MKIQHFILCEQHASCTASPQDAIRQIVAVWLTKILRKGI